MARRIQSKGRAVSERIARMKIELPLAGMEVADGVSAPVEDEEGSMLELPGVVPCNGHMDDQTAIPPPFARVGGLDPGPVRRSKSCGLPARPGGKGTDMDRETGVEGATKIHADEARNGQDHLEDERPAWHSETELYSWGRTDLGSSFQCLGPVGSEGGGGPSQMEAEEGKREEAGMAAGHGPNMLASTRQYSRSLSLPTAPLFAPVQSWYGRKNVVNLCSTLYHTVAVTLTGEVYGAGVNEDGQVSPDRQEPQLWTPVLVEPLLSQRVTMVSCGDNHTACLTASGAVVSFGNNEVGQLGHSADAASSQRVGPRTVVALGSRMVKQVACGYLFTLLLTSQGEVFSCGVGECGGHADGANRFQAERVNALRYVPVSGLATGASHALAITVTGRLWAWGQNRHGQAGAGAGVEVVQEPQQVLETAGVRSAACGAFHSVILGKDGRVWACGKNHRGQLGLPSTEAVGSSEGGDGIGGEGDRMEEGAGDGKDGDIEGGVPAASCYHVPTLVRQLEPLKVSMVACGDAHTLVLTEAGEVWSLGSNSHGQLGTGMPSRASSMASAWQWRAQRVPGLDEARVFMVAAGGEQSFAVGLGTGVATPSRRSELPVLSRDVDARELVRKFSVIKPAASCVGVGDLLSLIHGAARASDMDILERTLIDVFSSPSLLNGSFLALPTSSSRADKEELDGNGSIFPDLQIGNKIIDDIIRAPGDGAERAAGEKSNARSSSCGTQSASASGLAVQGLEAVYVRAMKLNSPPLLSRLVQAMSGALDNLVSDAKNLADPDSLRCLLAYWQCPLNSNTALSKDTFLKLCETVVSLPLSGRLLLLRFVRADYPPHLFATRLLRPLHTHIEYHLRINFGKGRAVPILVVTMSYLFMASEGGSWETTSTESGPWETEDKQCGSLISPDQFANAAVSALPDESLLHDLRTWKAVKEEKNMNRNVFTFCRYPFLLSAEAKRRLLYGEAVLEQQQAAQKDMMRQMFQGGPVMPYLVLRVDRNHLLNSTLAQVGQCDSMTLKKQLKVSFLDEEGVDEGGVKKEFFQLLTAQLFDFSYGMFKMTESKRDWWFNSSGTSFGDPQEYQLVGILVGLALYNSVLLDLHFPLVVYKKLLGRQVGLSDLREIEPELMEGLLKLLDYEQDAKNTGEEGAMVKVEDVFCLNFEVDWVEFDEVKRHELKPGGKDIEVTAANRHEYVDLYVQWVLAESIAKPFEAFKAGYDHVMGGSSISLLRPEELMLLVCGTPHLNLHELEAVAKYEGGYEAEHPVIKAFWSVVHEMDLASQRNFLMFVTGSAKAPIGGLGRLALLIQRAGPDSDNLPTAHTCFNTFLLPEYGSKEKLKERLMKAISECRGFGLQ